MEKHWFDSSLPRSRRTLFTIVGSVLLHGSLIAVAALYPVKYALPLVERLAKPITGELPPVGITLLPPTESFPVQTPSEPEPPVMEASADLPPPEVNMEMVAPAPPKPALKTVAAKSRSLHPTATVAPHGERGVPGAMTGARGAIGDTGTGHPGAAGRWNTPPPPYPYGMRAAHVQGSGSVRISTDGSGRVISATVVRSTGNLILDENTSNFARTAWSGPPEASVTVPITYQMR